MTYPEVLANARECIGKYCKACPVCNGVACKNQIPGPGAKGVGDTAIRNYNKWADIRVNMDTLCENGTPDTHVELFGKSFRLPFFAGPVGAVNLHYSDAYTDMTYNDVLVRACAENGIAAFTGDGTNPDVMTMATQAIGAAGGCGVPTIKPWNIDTVKAKMDQAKASGCFAVAMDVDAAGLPFLKNMTPPAGSKSVAELKEIVALAGRPFIVKGEGGRSGRYRRFQPRRPCAGPVPGDGRSPAGDRRCPQGQRRESSGRWRHPLRCGRLQGTGSGRGRCAHLPSLRHGGLRRRRRGRQVLHRQDRRGTG